MTRRNQSTISGPVSDSVNTEIPVDGVPEDQWSGVERIVAIGDVHGDYLRYMEALHQAGVIDSPGNWIAGKSHLVQIGDIADRGPDSARIIRHLMQLEQQAELAGGKVHALIGNHELMNLLGDLYYVHPGEFDALRGEHSERLRDEYLSRQEDKGDERNIMSLYMSPRRKKTEPKIPLGYVEHRELWNLDGEFGSWVAGHNTVIKINNILFVHAGIAPRHGNLSIRTINEQMRRELQNPDLVEDSIAECHDGPLWYRGLSLDGELVGESFVDTLLAFHGVDHVVVGHTPVYETIVPRYKGKVLVLDSGISSFYGGAITSLIIEDGKLVNVHRGEKIDIPTDDSGLLPYYRRIAELEPDSVSLRELISRLEAPGVKF